MKQEPLIKTIFRRIKKRISAKTLIILIVTLSVNSFAWFIYATKIDSSVSVHVRAWNVVFEAGDSEVTDTVNLVVDSIYPGMEDYEYQITAYNRSEVSANLSYILTFSINPPDIYYFIQLLISSFSIFFFSLLALMKFKLE